MKFIRQLFGQDSKNQRTATSTQPLDGQPQAVLEALVQGVSGDVDAIDVRVEALKRLPYSASICNALINGPKPLKKAASVRLAELIDEQRLSVTQLIEDVGDTEKLLTIAGHCKSPSLQDSVLHSVRDQSVLADICAQSSSSRVRKALAERIDQPELFSGLLKALKSKDKNVYKIIKAKAETIKAQQNALNEIQEKIGSLCNDIERHSTHVFDKDYSARLHRLMQRWSDLQQSADDHHQQRFEQARKTCQQRIDDKHQEEQAQRDYQANVSTADSKRQQLLEQLWQHINTLYELNAIDEVTTAALHTELIALKAAWQTQQQYGKIPAESLQQYKQLCEASEGLLQAYQQRGTLSQCYQRISDASDTEPAAEEDIQYLRQLLKLVNKLSMFTPQARLATYLSALQDIDRKKQQQAKFEQKQCRLIASLLRQSRTAIEQGSLKKALGIRHAIDEKLANLSALPKSLVAQQESLDADLQKLVDWQAYAVVPKKQALVDAMEQLVGCEIAPEILAEKIKLLQEQWKALSQSGKDRQEHLWEAFNQAADKAYEPCKAYYQTLSTQRQQNLSRRQTLVQQLENYHRDNDWEQADWKQVEKVLRTAKKEFYSYTPVSRSANKAVTESFDNIIGVIEEKLNTEFARNKATKRQIIQQAEQLLELSDLEQAIQQCKHLQAQWKNSGRCSYKDDNKLWQDFRHHCDIIFQRKQHRVEEQQTERQGHLNKANALIERLDGYLQLSGEDLLAQRSHCNNLKEEFNQIGELPQHSKPKIEQAFAEKMARFNQKVSQERQQLSLASWQQLFDLNEKINTCQHAFTSQDKKAPSMLEAIEANIDAMTQWPQGSQTLIKDKVAQIKKNDHPSLASNQQALKLLCIRAEIFSDMESPEADKQQRMEYQVSLLQQGLGQAKSSTQNFDELALEWCAIGPVESASYQVLKARFQHCWQKNIHNRSL